MPLIKIMSCRSKLMSVLFKQNKITLPFNHPFPRLQNNVILYNSFQSGRKTDKSPANKVRRGFGRNSTFGKDKFITRLNMPPNFSNQSDLLNTLRVGLTCILSGFKTCSLSQSENSKFNGVVLKGNNTRSEFDKTQTRSNIRHSGCHNTQDDCNTLQSRCNNRHTGCNNTQTGSNNRHTGYNNTQTGSNKNHTRHDHTQEDSDNSQKGQYKSKRGTRKRKIKSRNWSQYEKIAGYVFKGSLFVISLMKYFKEP